MPQIQVSVAILAPDAVATERFTVPLAPTPDTAGAFAAALGRAFVQATNRAIEKYKKSVK